MNPSSLLSNELGKGTEEIGKRTVAWSIRRRELNCHSVGFLMDRECRNGITWEIYPSSRRSGKPKVSTERGCKCCGGYL
nr:hypothetical protein [Halobacterium salinarum]